MEPDSTNALQTKINTKSVISSRANAATVDFRKTSSLGSWDGACKNTNRLLHKKNSEWLYLQKGREKGGRQDEGKKWKNWIWIHLHYSASLLHPMSACVPWGPCIGDSISSAKVEEWDLWEVIRSWGSAYPKRINVITAERAESSLKWNADKRMHLLPLCSLVYGVLCSICLLQGRRFSPHQACNPSTREADGSGSPHSWLQPGLNSEYQVRPGLLHESLFRRQGGGVGTWGGGSQKLLWCKCEDWNLDLWNPNTCWVSMAAHL